MSTEPRVAPSNVTLKAVSATEADFSWDPVEQHEMNGVLLGYEVRRNGKEWIWSKAQVQRQPHKKKHWTGMVASQQLFAEPLQFSLIT